MFDPLTRIAVIYSEIKNTGPRQGSIGYISHATDIQLVASRLLSAYIYTTTINFVRYGYEKRKRSEYKQVHALIPVNFDGKTQGIETFIEKLEDERIFNSFKDSLNTPTDNPFCIIGPLETPMNMLNQDDDIFYGWIETYLRYEQHNHILESFLDSEDSGFICTNLKIDYTLMRSLVSMVYDHQMKSAGLPMLADRKNMVIKSLRFVMLMSNLYRNNMVTSSPLNESSHLNNEGRLDPVAFYNKIIPYLYVPGLSQFLLHKIRTSCSYEKDHIIIDNLIKTQDAIRSLARCAAEGPGVGVGVGKEKHKSK